MIPKVESRLHGNWTNCQSSDLRAFCVTQVIFIPRGAVLPFIDFQTICCLWGGSVYILPQSFHTTWCSCRWWSNLKEEWTVSFLPHVLPSQGFNFVFHRFRNNLVRLRSAQYISETNLHIILRRFGSTSLTILVQTWSVLHCTEQKTHYPCLKLIGMSTYRDNK